MCHSKNKNSSFGGIGLSAPVVHIRSRKAQYILYGDVVRICHY
jgi:hypothetical protein